MTSTATRMQSPTLIPTPNSTGNTEAPGNHDSSEDDKQSTQPLEDFVGVLPVTTASRSTANDPMGSSLSSSKTDISSKTNENCASSLPEAVDVIDSALLAALRDPRERLGLLKLEQNLIDFLEKQPQDSYVDIGGPYNSTVISPTLGYIGQQPQQLQATVQAQTDGNNAGRPQTTFQRCILHRICDRFNMTRENSYTTDIYGCYLIRVCKGTDSKKPPRRLLNVKESEYQIPRPNPDNTSGNVASSNPSQQLTSNFQQLNISSMAPVPPSTGTSGSNNSSNTKASSKVRKMKIMKRSSSSVSNSSSGSNNSKAKNNAPVKTRSSLSEKEKKYAEARARIFEQEEENGNGNGSQSAVASSCNNSSNRAGTTGFSMTSSNNNSNRYSQGSQYSNSRDGSNSDTYGGCSYIERRGSYNNTSSYNHNRQSSQSPSSSSSTAGSTSSNPKAQPHNSSTTSLNSMSSNNSGKGNTSDCDQQLTSNTNTRSKATYRNRQQEETDPDFRRGAGIHLQHNLYAHAHTPVGYGGTNGGRGTGNVYYPSNMGVANGTNNNINRIGYGYTPAQQHQQQHQQQHYPYQYPQQNYIAPQHQQAQYYPTIGGRGQAYSTMQYQHQRRQHEQHYPALSSSATRK
mmetsp:Transcript_23629/g.55984  ORF Transcript_23629/g.55984 Transcript_23629/m.55984 type:complete len:628 (+) Transcript_23629:224-2107(+)|eukprot:CAMPEP_0197186902 /NCGR_PEP_ID=MMETSP1423-20130617/14837_1 /TAXON_ID=476441 /ORGANISM="Pseudo-nitzschia heimii, Strain UNC1101" /LENGTH=627 /DNA_ID=CAMNT_0042638337 /DNA_START=181 /DNA_END=2064 /DNA_ORIENTATION=+